MDMIRCKPILLTVRAIVVRMLWAGGEYLYARPRLDLGLSGGRVQPSLFGLHRLRPSPLAFACAVRPIMPDLPQKPCEKHQGSEQHPDTRGHMKVHGVSVPSWRDLYPFSGREPRKRPLYADLVRACGSLAIRDLVLSQVGLASTEAACAWAGQAARSFCWTTIIARTAPDALPQTALTEAEMTVVDCAVRDRPAIQAEKTALHYLLKIACLGGYLARRRPPLAIPSCGEVGRASCI